MFVIFFLSVVTFEHQLSYYYLDLYNIMNTEERALLLSKFVEHLDSVNAGGEQTFNEDINQLELNEDNLPRLDVVEELMNYHRDITDTIESTYNEVRDVMVHMKELKNRKKNVQVVIDSLTACVQIKRLSYGMGSEPKQISSNLQTYYQIKDKVYHMDKFIQRIEKQIGQIEGEYQSIFDAEMAKNNSSNIG